MVDLHTHVLWGLDDGARSLDESLAMLRMAGQYGTMHVVATPHASEAFPLDLRLRAERVRELTEACGGAVAISFGCELQLSYDNVRRFLDNPLNYTINGGQYLLLELPTLFVPSVAGSSILEILRRGITPVIAHPERYAPVQQDHTVVRRWVDQGCLIQITAASIAGRTGNRAGDCAWGLLRQNLVHAVASDGHNTVGRCPRLDQARHSVEKAFGESRAQALFSENPGSIVLDRPVDILEEPDAPRKPWYLRWLRAHL